MLKLNNPSVAYTTEWDYLLYFNISNSKDVSLKVKPYYEINDVLSLIVQIKIGFKFAFSNYNFNENFKILKLSL